MENMSNSKIKILITGGAGNVGSELAKKLSENINYNITVVDNLITGKISNLTISNFNNLEFIKCDVNDYNDISAVMLSHNFDYVFHYAALVGVTRTILNPLLVLNDIEGIKNILYLSKNTRVKKVFYSSSSEVYGEPFQFPQNENTTPLNAKLPYAIVKNLGEAYFRSFYREFGLNYTIFRFFNTYGPNQSIDFVVSKFINQCLTNSNICIHGDGSQTRTFCYIDDNIDTVIKIFENDLCNDLTLNIGNTNETSVLQLAQLTIDICKSNSKIVHLPPLLEGDMTRRLPDNTKMREILNRDLISLDDGISRILRFNNKI